MSRESNFVKSTFVLGTGNVLPKIFRLATLPIMTANLTKTDYGTFDLVIVMVTLFLPLITLQMQAAGFRFLIDVRENLNKQKEYITNIILFTLLTSIIALSVLYLCLFHYSKIIRLLIISYYFADVFLMTFQQIARGLGKNKLYVQSIFVSSFVELLLMFILLKIIPKGINGALSAIFLAEVLAALILMFRLNVPMYLNVKFFKKSTINMMLNYSWPLVPSSLSSWMVRLSNRLIITFFMGIEANAVYAIANKLPNMFGLVQGSFSMAWQENATIANEDKDSSVYYSKMFKLTFRFLTCFLALLIASTPLLFKILIRGSYDVAYAQIPLLYISVFLGCISSFLGGIYVAKMKSKDLAVTTVAAAFLNIVMCVVLTPIIGLYGSSISLVVSYTVLDVYRMRKLTKLIKMDYCYNEMFFLLIIIVCMGGLCLMRNFYFNLINILIAVLFCVTINRRNIFKMMHKIR